MQQRPDDKQFKNMNQFLEDLKTSSTSYILENSEVKATEKLKQQYSEKFDAIRQQLQKEKVRNEELVKMVETYGHQIKFQQQEINRIKESELRKDKIVQEVKTVVSKMTYEKDHLINQLSDQDAKIQKLVNIVQRQNTDQKDIKEQFSVCQQELSKAIELTQEFERGLNEERKTNQDLVQQIAVERKDRQNEKTSLEQIRCENKQLTENLNANQTRVQDLELQNLNLAKENNELNLQLLSEREELSKQKQMKVDIQKQISMENESLHEFYLKQMESIISEKVGTLQQHVKEWEKKLQNEKNEALNHLKAEHKLQIEGLRRQFKSLDAQIKASEAIHKASKREAYALKGQLDRQISPHRLHHPQVLDSLTSSDEEASGLASQRSLPPLNNKQKTHSRKSSVTTVMNNLQPEMQRRPRSADVALSSTIRPITPQESDSSLLTSFEKKDLVQSFIKQFLEDNPEAVFDQELLVGLSAKASKLINQPPPHEE